MSDAPPPYASVMRPVTSVEGEVQDPNLRLETSHMQNGDEKTLLLSVQPTKGSRRTPVHICCVIDISGSMGTEATFKNDTGSTESDGLSILDLVKHAIKTIISTMTENDVISLVSFSTNARIDLSPTSMDVDGKVKAIAKLETLHPEDMTNIWGGLELGWNTIQQNSALNQYKVQSVFLFTDGQPNVVPPRGHLPMIKMHMESNKTCTVNTFGFGYALDSPLLDEIARTCDGSFVFIPDSSFVGTAFINATANLYTVMAQDVNLRLQIPKNDKIKLKITGGYNVTETNWGQLIRVGNVRFDQPREFIVHIKDVGQGDQELFTVFLDYSIISPSTTKAPQLECLVKSSDWASPQSIDDLCRSILRCQFVDAIESCIKMGGESASQILALKASMSHPSVTMGSDPFILALKEDANGQGIEALQKEYYSRWGKHYLLSLAEAHRSQICNNFKDPGVQVYGGPLFRALRDGFDKIFNTLPNPTPSRPKIKNGVALPASRRIQMHTYNNCRGPCFHGNCVVELDNGETKLVSELVKGDKIRSGATVLCAVKTPILEGEREFVQFPNGLLATPYHPVYNEEKGEWKFPMELHPTVIVPCDAIYNFVLDSCHSMVINRVKCVTLGHGAKGDLREHPYFGTRLVLDDLKSSTGWDMGLVIVEQVLRDSVTGLINGMKFSEQEKKYSANFSKESTFNESTLLSAQFA